MKQVPLIALSMRPGCNLLANWNQNWVFKGNLPPVINILNFYSNTLTSNRTPNYCSISFKSLHCRFGKVQTSASNPEISFLSKKGCSPPISLTKRQEQVELCGQGFMFTGHIPASPAFSHMGP